MVRVILGSPWHPDIISIMDRLVRRHMSVLHSCRSDTADGRLWPMNPAAQEGNLTPLVPISEREVWILGGDEGAAGENAEWLVRALIGWSTDGWQEVWRKGGGGGIQWPDWDQRCFHHTAAGPTPPGHPFEQNGAWFEMRLFLWMMNGCQLYYKLSHVFF